jgi:hypothetical protein
MKALFERFSELNIDILKQFTALNCVHYVCI